MHRLPYADCETSRSHSRQHAGERLYLFINAAMLAFQEIGGLIAVLGIRHEFWGITFLQQHIDALGWATVIAPAAIAYVTAFLIARHIAAGFHDIPRHRLMIASLAFLLALTCIANGARLCLVGFD